MNLLSGRHLARLLTTTLLTTAALGNWLPPAAAKCHVATWDSDRVRVKEKAGFVELIIELDGRGQVTCTGTIKWSTQDGSAKSPADYKGGSGEIKWQPGSERSRTVRIPIVSDNLVEGVGETFHVVMTAGPGGITPEEAGPNEGGPRVAVFIEDDDAAQSPSASPSATLSASPTPTNVGVSPTPRESSGNSGLIVGIVAGLLALGGAATLLLRRRGS